MQMSNMRYSPESLDVLRHSLIKTPTERDLDSGDSQDSALQISRLEEPQPKALGDFNRIYDLHGRFINPNCSCHRWRFFKSPSILKGVIGSLQIIHDMTFLSIKRCDDANCFGQIARQIADINYMFPSWFSNCLITLIYSSSLRYGPSFVLRQTRINPFTGSLYRAATEPDGLEYVEKLLNKSSSAISEVDTNGDTVLHVFRSPSLPRYDTESGIISL